MRSNLTCPIAVLFSLGALCTINVQAAVSQTSSDLQSSSPQQPLKVFEQENPDDASNLFTDRASGTSLLNLLNRIQQVNSRSSGEFAEDQAESFDSAVEAFRKKQQQQELGNQGGTAPSKSDAIEK